MKILQMGLQREGGLSKTWAQKGRAHSNGVQIVLVVKSMDPLNFEDYHLLANSNLEVANQNVEVQFWQDRINFPCYMHAMYLLTK